MTPLHTSTITYDLNKFRWLATEGIKVASEKKQRALSKELITVDIKAEHSL